MVMESKPLRTAGRTVFVAALPTEDTLKRLVAAASSSSSSPAYSSSTAPAVATAARGLGPGEASGGGGDRPVSSAGKGLFLINGRWFNARGEPVEPPGSSRSDNVNATRGGRASSAGAGGGGSGPDSVGAKDVDPLRSAALEAAMKELGLSDLPVPPHVATARKAAAAAQGSGGGQGLGSGAGQDAASIGFKAAAAVALRFQSQGAVYDYAGRQAVDDYEDSEIEEMLEARLDEEVLGLPPRPAKRKPQLQGTVTSSGRSGGAAAAAAASGSATSRSGASQAGSNTQRGSPLMGTAQGAAAAGAGRKVAAAGSRSLSLTGRLSDGNSTSRLSSRGSATAAGGGAASNASVSPEKQKKNWDDLT